MNKICMGVILVLIFAGNSAAVTRLSFTTADDQTQIALQESEAHLRALINALPDLVWLKDSNGVYLSCNSKFERFFGAKENQIVGRTDLQQERVLTFRKKMNIVSDINFYRQGGRANKR